MAKVEENLAKENSNISQSLLNTQKEDKGYQSPLLNSCSKQQNKNRRRRRHRGNSKPRYCKCLISPSPTNNDTSNTSLNQLSSVSFYDSQEDHNEGQYLAKQPPVASTPHRVDKDNNSSHDSLEIPSNTNKTSSRISEGKLNYYTVTIINFTNKFLIFIIGFKYLS